MWKVDDASTAELMKAVYRNITSGVPRDEALRAVRVNNFETLFMEIY